MTAYAADGQVVPLLVVERQAYKSSTWDKTLGWTAPRWTVGYGKEERDATAEEVKIAVALETLEAPIFDRYDSFAGEFDAYGTVTWDVAAGTVTMNYNESHESWDSGEESY